MSSRNLLQNNFNKFLPGKVSVANLGNIQGDSINENAIRSKFESTFTVTADELKANKKNSLMIQFLVNLACYGGSNVADQKRGIDFKSLTISNLMRAYIFDIYRAILKFQIKAKKITKGTTHDLMLKKDATMKDYKVDEWKLIAEFVKEKSTLYSKYVRTGKTLTDRQTSTLILPGIFLIPKKLEISQDAFAVYTSISTAIGDLAEIQNSEDTAEQSLIYMKKVSNLSKAMDAKYYTEGMNMYKALKQADSIVGHSSKDLLDIFAVFKSKPIYEKGLALNQANLSRGKGKSKLTNLNAKQQTSNKSN